MGDELKHCTFGACTNEARMAVTTSRPSHDKIWTRVWWDDRTAPPSADRLCKKHGAELLRQLADTLCNLDSDEE